MLVLKSEVLDMVMVGGSTSHYLSNTNFCILGLPGSVQSNSCSLTTPGCQESFPMPPVGMCPLFVGIIEIPTASPGHMMFGKPRAKQEPACPNAYLTDFLRQKKT